MGRGTMVYNNYGKSWSETCTLLIIIIYFSLHIGTALLLRPFSCRHFLLWPLLFFGGCVVISLRV